MGNPFAEWHHYLLQIAHHLNMGHWNWLNQKCHFHDWVYSEYQINGLNNYYEIALDWQIQINFCRMCGRRFPIQSYQENSPSNLSFVEIARIPFSLIISLQNPVLVYYHFQRRILNMPKVRVFLLLSIYHLLF